MQDMNLIAKTVFFVLSAGGKAWKELRKLGFAGRLFIDHFKPLLDGEEWMFDNGAFRDYLKGRKFDEKRFFRSLEKAMRHTERYRPPYLSVLPGIVAGGTKSLEFSYQWYVRLEGIIGKERFRKMNWALAVQDGLSPEDVEGFLKSAPAVRGIFLGGSDRYKATAGIWAQFARKRGLRFHYARVSSVSRFVHALQVEADSVDSQAPFYIEKRLRKFISGAEILFKNRKLWKERGVLP